MNECPIFSLRQFHELVDLFFGVRDYLRNEYDIRNVALAHACGPLGERTLKGEHVVAFGMQREPIVCTVDGRKLPIVFEKELKLPDRDVNRHDNLCDRLILDGELGALMPYASNSAIEGFKGIAEIATWMVYALEPGDRLDERCILMGIQHGAHALDRPSAIDGVRIIYHEKGFSAEQVRQSQVLQTFIRLYRNEIQPLVGRFDSLAVELDGVALAHVQRMDPRLPTPFSFRGRNYPIQYNTP